MIVASTLYTKLLNKYYLSQYDNHVGEVLILYDIDKIPSQNQGVSYNISQQKPIEQNCSAIHRAHKRINFQSS